MAFFIATSSKPSPHIIPKTITSIRAFNYFAPFRTLRLNRPSMSVTISTTIEEEEEIEHAKQASNRRSRRRRNMAA
jgi:hypothetical protein